jgi:hypothetical protein
MIAMESMATQGSMNAEHLTWDQICDRFPDEWVVLVEADWVNDRDFEFGTALVLGHYKRRKEASPHIKAAFELYPQIGCFWTGEVRGPTPRYIAP